jgi:hypothetical protein
LYVLTILQNDMLPVRLGTPGSIILSAIAIVLALLNAYQWKKSATAQQWKGAAEAHKANLEAVRERADRLSAENKEMLVCLAELRAKTDLTSLERQNLESDRRNQEVHERIVLTLNTLQQDGVKQSAQFSAALLENTSAINALGDRMTLEFELHRQAFADMTVALQGKTDRPRGR